MQIFFENLESLHRYSLNLKLHLPKCPHCQKSEHHVSHGFVYREGKAIGKRILCSHRGNHQGCGRTTQLYLQQVIPSLQFTTTHLVIFIQSLIFCFNIQKAYFKATKTENHRNAYRWLLKLWSKLSDFKTFTLKHKMETSNDFSHRCRRLQILLPTLENIMIHFEVSNPLEQFQVTTQTEFL